MLCKLVSVAQLLCFTCFVGYARHDKKSTVHGPALCFFLYLFDYCVLAVFLNKQQMEYFGKLRNHDKNCGWNSQYRATLLLPIFTWLMQLVNSFEGPGGALADFIFSELGFHSIFVRWLSFCNDFLRNLIYYQLYSFSELCHSQQIFISRMFFV